MSCYVPVGEQMDVLALLNSSFNFILYCLMSSQFRNTLSSIFWNKENFLSRKNEEIFPLSQMALKSDVISIRSNLTVQSNNGSSTLNCLTPRHQASVTGESDRLV